jgi:hypothetical protein
MQNYDVFYPVPTIIVFFTSSPCDTPMIFMTILGTLAIDVAARAQKSFPTGEALCVRG